MAEDPIPSSEPEITPPQPTAAQRPSRPDPGVIDGQATEIRDEASTAAAAPEDASEAAAAPPPESPRLPSYAAPAAAGFGGAILGAALALITAWAIEPHAAAVNDLRARLATLEQSTASQAAASTALEKRVSGLATGGADKAAFDALDRRIGAVEAAAGDAKTALDQARAARADAAKALAAAEGATSADANSPDAGELAPRLAKLESDLAAADARLDRLAGLDDQLAKLEGASAAPKTQARAAPEAGPSGDGAAVAVLASSLEQRFAAGAPYAPEFAALSRLGVAGETLAPLKPFADSGAPTLAALNAGWAKVEPAVVAATTPSDRSAWDRLLDHLRGLVRVRPIGAAAGAADAPPVAQVGAALQRGDSGAALDAFAKLPEAARAAAQPWADAAKSRQAAAAAAEALRADAIGRLATTKD